MERIYHTWDKWECYRAGFFEVNPPKGITDEECERAYRDFLKDIPLFQSVMREIICEWKYSCEHNLTNQNMNRIAWMGQASLAYHLGIPSRYRGGYNLLTEDQQEAADLAALEVINEWMVLNDHPELTLKTVESRTQMNLY